MDLISNEHLLEEEAKLCREQNDPVLHDGVQLKVTKAITASLQSAVLMNQWPKALFLDPEILGSIPSVNMIADSFWLLEPQVSGTFHKVPVLLSDDYLW
ncbi:hypothetical protein PsorP6_011969 [Peronosclerospora sorghi]|uniref:Uncharacterized protein n=1 Tax=Peronosclerospora sorghi TaxID=230839 RepID=A0ACC0WKG6_9STRA|nr:hypothetical protein PsorP6_011969 [Peronosclerospora sorghi]